VFGIYGHADAARLTYLGFLRCSIEVRNPAASLRQTDQSCAGTRIYGPTRLIKPLSIACRQQATTRFAIPLRVMFHYASATLLVTCQHGQIAICHKGNLPFALEERRKLERRRHLSATSDTEVILHGVARSKAASVREAPEFYEHGRRFSMLFLTHGVDRIRDPRGFARWRWATWRRVGGGLRNLCLDISSRPVCS